MYTIDLNCDLGEGFPFDGQLIPLISSVNIACGGHAGDDNTMREAIRTARDHGVNAGAHPGYEDRAGFGRVELSISPAAVKASVIRQVGRLNDIAVSEGACLTHVKPHGALYNSASKNADLAEAIVQATADVLGTVAVMGPPLSQLEIAARGRFLPFIAEGFVDRRYQHDGALVPRSIAGGVINDINAAVRQAIEIVQHSRAISIDGVPVSLDVKTLCLHGDSSHALELLRELRSQIDRADPAIRVTPFLIV